jgi:carbamoyl-phosphate synthase large subunit
LSSSATPNRIPTRNALVYTYDRRHQELISQVASLLSTRLEVYSPEDLGERVVDMLRWKKIDIVITGGDTPDADFHIRRLAADTNTPLVLDSTLALELAKAFLWYYNNGRLEVSPW